jgi:hypothetical protein
LAVSHRRGGALKCRRKVGGTFHSFTVTIVCGDDFFK